MGWGGAIMSHLKRKRSSKKLLVVVDPSGQVLIRQCKERHMDLIKMENCYNQSVQLREAIILDIFNI